MLGKRRAAWILRPLVADVVVLLVSFVVAYEFRVALDRPFGRAAAPLGYYLWLLYLILPVWVGLLAGLGGYGLGWTTRSRTWLILRVTAIGLILLTAGLFLVKESEINRSVLALFAAVSGVLLWGERGLIQARLRRVRHGDRWARLAVVVGDRVGVPFVYAAKIQVTSDSSGGIRSTGGAMAISGDACSSGRDTSWTTIAWC
jgi:FlaA1/EpsC-like NDP-sugar epimerase